MRIAVMGAGGVGGYFGGRLAQHGEDVAFVARGAHLRALRDRGLVVRSRHGDFTVPRVRATDTPTEIGPVDVVMFCVKAWDTDAAARMLEPLIGAETAVISFQNGVDNEERIAATVGSPHVMGGVSYVSAAIAEPGVIEQVSDVARLVFGELDGEQRARAGSFNECCQAAGIDAEVSDDIECALWTKFVYICALSGLTSVIRSPIGPILGEPATREMFVSCMREVEAVARKKGVRLHPDVVPTHLAFADAFGGGLKSSMLLDLERGNRLEVEWLNGVVARLGEHLNVPTPINRFLYTALKLHANGRA